LSSAIVILGMRSLFWECDHCLGRAIVILGKGDRYLGGRSLFWECDRYFGNAIAVLGSAIAFWEGDRCLGSAIADLVGWVYELGMRKDF
jgi:hypothetical protein